MNRTWNKIWKIILSYLLIAACLICMKADVAFAEDTVLLHAKAAVLMDGDTGRVLYGKNETEILPMASTTKIMTLILALEYGNPEDLVTVSSYAAKMPDVKLGMRTGEQYRLLDLLYSMMLESHNDSACAVAEHIGGSVESFAKMMNRKAEELGLISTYFITPNGLDAEDAHGVHSTSARDLAKLMRYCVFISEKKDAFRKICQTRQYSFSNQEKTRSFALYNKNALLDQMEGVIAGKTGFTGDAGYCYVCAVTIEGKQFIVSLLACGWPHNRQYKWADTKTLLSYGNNRYHFKTIDFSEFPVPRISVKNGQKNEISCACSGKQNMLLAEDEKLYVRVKENQNLRAPAAVGDTAGTLYLCCGDAILAKKEIYCTEAVDEKDFSYYQRLVFDCFFY